MDQSSCRCGILPGCGGNCLECSFRGGEYSLTPEEIDFLTEFSVIPFLPVACGSDGETPVYLEQGDCGKTSETIMWLKLKGLITVDYDMPLKNFDYSSYSSYSRPGSMALTAAGQAVLDALEIDGAR